MYKFQPILKSLIWGGEKIAPYKQIATDQHNIGESWELSGVEGNESVVAEGPEAGTKLPDLLARHGAALLGKANYERFGNEFPLLIKFIDARQDLSIQVHPNDELAWERHRSKGKTEMWYVVSTDEGAHLLSGFSKQVTPEEYEASVADNTITDLLARYERAIHTQQLDEGQPVLAVEGWERNRYVVGEDGYLYNAGSSHISDSQLSGINIGAPMPAGRSLPQE